MPTAPRWTLLLLLVTSGCAVPAPSPSATRVSIQGDRWQIDGRPTNPGSPAEGLLVNVRMVNAVFEDTGPAAAANLPGFDPDANTDAFVRRIPEYVAAGVNAFTLSVQGGMAGYEGAVNSAFEADGRLREGYMGRVARVIEAADRAGAVVILGTLYQRQHSHPRALRDRESIRAAVANLASWVRLQGYRNVVLEIANEYAHAGYARWPEGEWLRSAEGQVELIREAQRAAPGVPVSTAGMGTGTIPAPIAEAADFVLLHLNNTPLDSIPTRILAARRFGKPVLVNEDDKIGLEGATAARLTIQHGAGWGFMHSAHNQHFPFRFDGPADDAEVYGVVSEMTGRR